MKTNWIHLQRHTRHPPGSPCRRRCPSRILKPHQPTVYTSRNGVPSGTKLGSRGPMRSNFEMYASDIFCFCGEASTVFRMCVRRNSCVRTTFQHSKEVKSNFPSSAPSLVNIFVWAGEGGLKSTETEKDLPWTADDHSSHIDLCVRYQAFSHL